MNTPTPNGPSKEKLEELCSYLQAGLPLRLAANGIGVTEETLRRWMNENPMIEVAVGSSEAVFQSRCIKAILSARDRIGNVNVRAVMWLLESRFPDEYGRRKSTRSKLGLQPLPDIPSPEEAEELLISSLGSTVETTSATTDLTVPETTSHTDAQQPAPTPNNACACEHIMPVPKIGRNEPCPCGSGHKFKHCCGATNTRAKRSISLVSSGRENLATA